MFCECQNHLKPNVSLKCWKVFWKAGEFMCLTRQIRYCTFYYILRCQESWGLEAGLQWQLWHWTQQSSVWCHASKNMKPTNPEVISLTQPLWGLCRLTVTFTLTSQDIQKITYTRRTQAKLKYLLPVKPKQNKYRESKPYRSISKYYLYKVTSLWIMLGQLHGAYIID